MTSGIASLTDPAAPTIHAMGNPPHFDGVQVVAATGILHQDRPDADFATGRMAVLVSEVMLLIDIDLAILNRT